MELVSDVSAGTAPVSDTTSTAGAVETDKRPPLTQNSRDKKSTAKRPPQPVEPAEPEVPPGVRGGSHLSELPPAAACCKVDGTGLRLAIARQSASFTIESCDAEGTPLHLGGANFFVAVRGSSLVKAKVADNADGTYTAEYRPSVSGKFSIAVSLGGTPLPGSPFALSVVQPRPDPSQCVLSGDALVSAVAREPTTFYVDFVDVLGNVTHAEDLDVWVELVQKSASIHNANGADVDSGTEDMAAATMPVTDATAVVIADGLEAAAATVHAVEPPANPTTAASTEAVADISDGPSLEAGGGPVAAGDVGSGAVGYKENGGGSPSTAGAASTYSKLEAGERQSHLQLWARRLAADKALAAAAASDATFAAKRSAALPATGSQALGGSRVATTTGLNLVNEILSDPKGIGFAYGGINPGTLHAKGQLVARHSVHYSVGLAAKYRLHVGLRQQGVSLPGSPFDLTVLPGTAYAPSTRMPTTSTSFSSQQWKPPAGTCACACAYAYAYACACACAPPHAWK